MQPSTSSPAGLRKWLPLGVLSLALVIIILDTTILNVSLRTIINELKTDIQSIQWVITAYSLMLAAFTVTGGRLGDLFGRKRMFMVGAIIFAIGSFTASISTSVGMLIIGEAIIEGVGAALMMPATMSLITSLYRGRDRQIGFGIWGAIAGAAAALGPIVGGWLTTYASWRWAFRINVFVAVLLLVGSIFIAESRDKEEQPTLDFVGVFLSALGLLALVFGFIKASDYGWWTMKQSVSLFGLTFTQGGLSLVPICIVLGFVILALFSLWENHIMQQGKIPLVSLKLFHNRQFSLAIIILGIMALGQSGLTFAIPVFLQAVRHLNALDTGIAMLPMSLTILVVAPLTAVLTKYIAPKRLIQLGLALAAVGFLTMLVGVQVNASDWSLAPGFILFGAGMGLMMSQLSNMIMSSVSVQEAGQVSGVNTTMRTVGQTLGSAVIGAVLISTLSTNLVNGVNASPVLPAAQKPAIARAVSQQTSNIEFGSTNAASSATLPAFMTNELTRISQSATVDSMHTTLLISTAFLLLALFLSMWLSNAKQLEPNVPIARANAAPDGTSTPGNAPRPAPVSTPSSSPPPLIEVRDVSKVYGDGDSKFTALDHVSLTIRRGESLAIVGKSGSGKSTLMHLLAQLDRPSSGQIFINGQDASRLSDHTVRRLRNKHFGFVFQQFFLNANATVLDNVMLPLTIAGLSPTERKARGLNVLRQVELEDKADNKAKDLSGGQKQRVVIARALINQPQVIFADEPTGNLDSSTGHKIEDILFGLNKKHHITLVIVTHDLDLAKHCDRAVLIKDGRILGERQHAPATHPSHGPVA